MKGAQVVKVTPITIDPLDHAHRLDHGTGIDWPRDNCEVLSLLRPRTVGINAALDLRDPLLMTVNHAEDRDHSADQNCSDRDQENPQSEDRVNQPIHSPPPQGQRFLTE